MDLFNYLIEYMYYTTSNFNHFHFLKALLNLQEKFTFAQIFYRTMSTNQQQTLKLPNAGIRWIKVFRLAMPGAIKTSKWLLKLTLPVSLGVFLLNYTGVINAVSVFVSPFFQLLGLPAETALLLLTSIFTNIYSVVAVLSTLNLPVREATILAVMTLISHGFIIETAVLKKTGSSAIRMLLLRLTTSIIAGILLNIIMPQFSGTTGNVIISEQLSFVSAFMIWLEEMAWMTLKILLLVSALMILQKAMEEFGIIQWLSKISLPLLKPLGLPANTSLSWIIANAIGLAYGSAVMLEQVETQKMNKQEADLLNHHIAISHSQLEDPLLFMAVNLPLWWLIWPRIVLAVIAVWLRRWELSLKMS